MPAVVHLTRADARVLPWKNGRGTTEELALWPRAASFERADFDWRISRARIDADGPFSAFPGFERILLVTAGEGLLLSHGERAARARVRRLEPYAFSGDWPTAAELAAGPVADFNVLTRRGTCRADVSVLPLGRRRVREELDARHAFAHVLAGAARARVTAEEEPFELGAWDSLWIREPGAGAELELLGQHAECVVVLVRIAPDD
jgi:environmental stress-induced protein Ves